MSAPSLQGCLAQPLPATYRVAVMADAPVGYWRMSEVSGSVVNDISGSGYHMTKGASVTLGSASLLVNDSDPSATFAVTTANAGLNRPSAPVAMSFPGNAPMTFECWVARGVSAVGMRLGECYVQANTGWACQITSTAALMTRIGAGASTASSISYTITGGQASDGLPHHWVFVYTGSTHEVWLDGVLGLSVGSQTGTVPGGSSTLGIGQNNANVAKSFTGVLDEVAIYASALSGTRIAAHYAIGKGL